MHRRFGKPWHDFFLQQQFNYKNTNYACIDGYLAQLGGFVENNDHLPLMILLRKKGIDAVSVSYEALKKRHW